MIKRRQQKPGELKARDSGMTLVEVMAVLFIMALMTTAVALSRPSGPPPMKAQSENLLVMLNSAAQQSLITGEVYSFGLSQQGYALYKFENGEWMEMQNGFWPDGLTPRMVKERAEIKLTEDLVPLVTFDPTGISTPFELTLYGPLGHITLMSTGNGRVAMDTAS